MQSVLTIWAKKTLSAKAGFYPNTQPPAPPAASSKSPILRAGRGGSRATAASLTVLVSLGGVLFHGVDAAGGVRSVFDSFPESVAQVAN